MTHSVTCLLMCVCVCRLQGLQRPTIRRHAPSRTLRMQDEVKRLAGQPEGGVKVCVSCLQAVAEPPAPPPSAVAPTAPPVTFSSLEEVSQHLSHLISHCTIVCLSGVCAAFDFAE